MATTGWYRAERDLRIGDGIKAGTIFPARPGDRYRHLLETGAVTVAAPPEDAIPEALKGNVKQAVSHVEAVESVEELHQLAMLEAAGKNRAGVLNAISARRQALQAPPEEEGDGGAEEGAGDGEEGGQEAAEGSAEGEGGEAGAGEEEAAEEAAEDSAEEPRE